MLAWIIVANDFGFPPFQLIMTNGIFIYLGNTQDIYNPTSPYFGNSKLAQAVTSGQITTCGQYNSNSVLIDWLYSQQAGSDLRMSALSCTPTTTSPFMSFQQVFQFGPCRVQQISPYSNRPVCFTTEAIKYAQSSYFYTNFVGQLFNNITTKTRRESIFSQGMHNMNMYFGMTT
jgi:sodium/potassium-transporting ATPase subunit alpha